MPARRLYEGAGYETVARDPFLVSLIGMDRRSLLRKRLAPRSDKYEGGMGCTC